MDRKERILKWRCHSGNECAVTVSEDCAQELRLSFTWMHVPSADDREEWRFAILLEAVDRLREYAFFARAGVEVLRTSKPSES